MSWHKLVGVRMTNRVKESHLLILHPYSSDYGGANRIIEPTKINLFLDSGRVSVIPGEYVRKQRVWEVGV